MFCYALLYVHSSFAIILMGKRELVALLSLSSWCLVIVVWLFLAVPWIYHSLQFVILVFPDHTHYFLLTLCMQGNFSCFCCRLLTFFKNIFFFKKFFQKHYQSIKPFRSRSGLTFCLSWYGSKLFATVINRLLLLLTRRELIKLIGDQRDMKFIHGKLLLTCLIFCCVWVTVTVQLSHQYHITSYGFFCMLHWYNKLAFSVYSKTCLKQPLKNRQNKDLNEGQKICKMLPWSILQYFWPAWSDKWSWKPIFGLFESSRFRQVLL